MTASNHGAATILVTGGAGYIGAHAVHHLRDAGYQPVVLDDMSTGCLENIPADIPVIEGDVGDTGLLAEIFTGHRINAVMHFAGSVIVRESVSDPGSYYANNTANTLILMRQMATFNIPHLVFSSSAAVYGALVPDEIPVSEDTMTRPVNPYGSSKLMSERMILDVVQAHGMSASILRYFNVAGADAAGRAGQSTPRATHLIKVAAECAVGRREQVEIFGDDYPTPDGTCIRDYIHVDDLISAHLLTLDNLLDGGGTEVFNCGYGHGYSVISVLDTVEQVTGRAIKRVKAERRVGDPPILVANSDKLRKKLGWLPLYDSLETIVASAVSWERSLM